MHITDFSVSVNNVLAKICDNYKHIYLANLETDTLVPLKKDEENGIMVAAARLSWTKGVPNLVHNRACEEDSERVLQALEPKAMKKALSKNGSLDVMYRQKDGTWIYLVVSTLSHIGDTVDQILVTLTDVTESHKNAEAANYYSQLFFNASTDMYAAIFRVNLSTEVACILSFEAGKPVETLFCEGWDALYARFIGEIHPEDSVSVVLKTNKDALSKLSDGDKVEFVYRSKVMKNGYRWYSTVVRLTVEDNGDRVVTVFTVDISDDMNERHRLKERSEKDELTDLYNRTKLDLMIETDYSTLLSCGVMFFDINELKTVNDSMGHMVGDKLICLIADSIRSITNKRIHAYRYGGDEFIVVVCDAIEIEMNQLLKLWSSRLKTLAENVDFPCGVAYGLAWKTRPVSVMELIGLADVEMYECKRRMKANP